MLQQPFSFFIHYDRVLIISCQVAEPCKLHGSLWLNIRPQTSLLRTTWVHTHRSTFGETLCQ